MKPDRPDISAGPALAALAALYVASVLVRGLCAGLIAAPVIFIDEWLHLELARGLATTGEMAWRGTPVNFACWAYPALLAPIAGAMHPVDAVVVIRWLNCAVISLVLPITYGLARELTSRSRALTAAALVALLPGLGYSALLMAENLFVPVVTLSLWFIFRASNRPGSGSWIAWSLAAGCAMGLAAHVKPQGLYLPLIYVGFWTCVWFAPRLRGYVAGLAGPSLNRPAILPHALALLGWVVAAPLLRLAAMLSSPASRTGFDLNAWLGIHEFGVTSASNFHAAMFIPIFLVYFGTWILTTGLLPAVALARDLLTGRADPPADPSAPPDAKDVESDIELQRRRHFTILTAVTVAVFVGMIAFHNASLVAEFRAAGRYTLPTLPLVMILFCVHAPRSDRKQSLGAKQGWIKRNRILAGLAALMIGGCGAAAARGFWTFGFGSPSMSALYIALFPGRIALPVSILFYGALLGGFALLAIARGRFAFRAAAVAAVFIAMNIGWYAGHKYVVDPKRAVHHEIGREIAAIIPRGEPLAILIDDLDPLTMSFAGFYNPGRTLYDVYLNPPWHAGKARFSEGGQIDLGSDPVTWLLASNTTRFNRTPDYRFSECSLYRVDPSDRLVRLSD